MNKLKISYVTFFIYIAIMAVSMAISYSVFNAAYSTPEMFNYLWISEIILSLLVVYVVVKYFSWKDVGFNKINTKQLLWLLPLLLIIILSLFGQVSSLLTKELSPTEVDNIVMIGITTIFVGFSEELMFRGIILNNLLKTTTKTKAVLISSFLFGALHFANMLAGLSPDQMMFQFVFTLIYGMYFTLVYLKIRSIIPLIILHFLWDFSAISSQITGNESPALLPFILIVFQVVVIIILFKNINKQ